MGSLQVGRPIWRPRAPIYIPVRAPFYVNFGVKKFNYDIRRCSNVGVPRSMGESKESGSGDDGEKLRRKKVMADKFLKAIPEENSAIVSACLVGLLTGVAVVLFNNSVHELRDLLWDGIPSRGASWLREEPIELTWKKTVLVPVCGGVLVGLLNMLRDNLEVPSSP